MKHRPRPLVLVLIAASLIAVTLTIVSVWGALNPGTAPVHEVRRDRFVHKVSGEGILKAARSTPLTVPVTLKRSVKIAWMVDDGTPVQQGDVVVRFDSTDLETELLDGRVGFVTAESKIAKTRTEGGAKIRNFDRDSEVAQLELDSARKFQSKDEEILSRNEIIESEINEELATRRLTHLDGTRETQKVLSKAEEDLLFIERRKANMKIQQAEESLRSLEVRAPHEGIVVFHRDWRGDLPQVGDMAWRGQPLAEIPVLEQMEAEVQVLEADAGGLAVERPALVILEGRPDVTFEAKIRRVDNVPKPRARGIPVQYFGVTLALSQTDPAIMKPGLRVHATLMLEERSNSVAVPLQAVFEREGQKVAYRLTKGQFDAVPVVLGPVSHGRVIVEQGLEEGDVIALRDPTAGLLGSLIGGSPSQTAPTATPKSESSR